MKPLSILCINKSHFVPELKARGHKVLVAVAEDAATAGFDNWSINKVDIHFRRGETLAELLKKLPDDFNPDRIVYYDDSSPIFGLRGIETSSVPTLFYSVDAHIHHLWHPQMSGIFDTVLVAQKDFLPYFQARVKRVVWFPLWASTTTTPGGERNIKVCFRGSLERPARTKRADFIEALSKLVTVDCSTGPYLEGFPKAEIVLNESISDDVNFRVFEAMGCGAVLLTQRTENGLLELFEDGKHLVTYNSHDADDAAAKISALQSDPAKLAAIARCGYERILERHTATVRAHQLEEELYKMNETERSTADFAVAYRELFEIAGWPPKDASILLVRIASAYKCFIAMLSRRPTCDIDSVFMALFLTRLLNENHMQEELKALAFKLVSCWPENKAIILIAFTTFKLLNLQAEAEIAAQKIGLLSEDLENVAPTLINNLRRESYLETMVSS